MEVESSLSGGATSAGPRCGPAEFALAPAALLTEGRVLRVDALHGIPSDELDACVDVAGRLRTAARGCGALLDAEGRHLERVLLRGRVDHAGLDAVLDRLAAAVDGDHDVVLRVLAGRLQRGGGPEGRRLVDRVDHV